MMNLRFVESNLAENRRFFRAWQNTLSSVFDNYYEDHILDGRFYRIILDQRPVGFFSIFAGKLLTLFYMDKADYRYAQPIFAQMLRAFPIESAYVSSCDEFYLSLCLDTYRRHEMQAYSFLYSEQAVRPAAFPRSDLRLTERSEWAEINRHTENFFDEADSAKAKQPSFLFEIYELCHEGEVLGYGLREQTRIFTNYQATGMYTLPQHRRRGVGRSIILHLKDICEEQGFLSLPGCWYYNHNSKRTLESCGFVSRTRLLKVFFDRDESPDKARTESEDEHVADNR